MMKHLPTGLVRILSGAHTAAMRLTGGRLGRRLAGKDMLLLTTTGRRSGKAHTVPLLYVTDGETIGVIASYGGRDVHPDWYLNLSADPHATVRLDGLVFDTVARDADQEERRRFWHRAVETHRGYLRYQARTRREIPVVLLERPG